MSTTSDATPSTDLAAPAGPREGDASHPAWQWPARWRRHSQAQSPPPYLGHQYLTVCVVVVLAAVVVPAVMSSRSAYFNTNLWLIYSITGIGFYWMLGLAGRFAFSQTFMMALGAYTSAWVTRNLGDGSFVLGLAIAMAATAILAAFAGAFVRKAQFFFFAIATLAVSEIGLQLLRQGSWLSGDSGTVSGVSPPTLFGLELVNYEEIFWLLLAVFAIVALLGAFVERSPLRREAVAARDNLLVSRVAGVPATRVQLSLFVMGSALGGLSGALLGHANGVVGTSTFGFDLAIGIFLMLFLGGVRSMWGPVVGAAFYVALPQVLSGLERYYLIVYGLLLLVVVLALPDGIMGLIEQVGRWIRRRWARRPSARSPAAEADRSNHGSDLGQG